MKKFVYKYYWLIAGFLVGLMSVVLCYFNFNLILQESTATLFDNISISNSFSWIGAAEIVLEYMVVVYALSLGQKLFKK